MENVRLVRAGRGDIERLVPLRVEVLRAANLLSDDADMSEVEVQSRRYYEEHIDDGTHIAYLAMNGEEIVGTGAICFYEVMPTCCNREGRKAYIMNMYTRPDCRRMGIGRSIVERLIAEAHTMGVEHITLEATELGRRLYESCGFRMMDSEMQYFGN